VQWRGPASLEHAQIDEHPVPVARRGLVVDARHTDLHRHHRPLTAIAFTIATAPTADKTSHAVKLSSCLLGVGWHRGERGVFVVGLAGAQAVVQAAEEAVEQVALRGRVAIASGSAPVVVGAGAG
jgi:hypothetical protein